MRRTLPLAEHPEFSSLECQGWREYRVENRRLLHARGLLGYYWFGATLIALLAFFWPSIYGSRIRFSGVALGLAIHVYLRCTEILWESVVVFPHLGIQLETHRGLPRLALFTSRRFIPLSTLQDFIINEGIRRWSVRYYAVAIQRSPSGIVHLDVVFENLLPRFPILLEVYHGVHETLLCDTSNRDVRASET